MIIKSLISDMYLIFYRTINTLRQIPKVTLFVCWYYLASLNLLNSRAVSLMKRNKETK